MTSSVTPFFLDGPAGRLFCLQMQPAGEPRGQILYLPPFCEEMNRCRNLAADQARLFTEAGYSCLLLDPRGTGDSEGELADSNWVGWLEDALTAARYCRERQDIPVILWGLRLGGLLALDLAARNPGEFNRIILWQPVTTGKTYLTQTLRARIAYLSGAGLPPETTEEMRNRLAQGERVEVAGYVLGGEMAADIDALKVADLSSLADLDLHWLQQTSRPDDGPSSAVGKVVDQLRAQGNRVEVAMFQSPQLWQLSERASCQQLLDKTSALELS